LASFELWDDLIRQASGRLNSSADADALKIDVNMCGVLAKCGAFRDVDPKTVDMGTGPALSDTEQ
jgi:hypothetical protein